ncbi:hypothetical protein EDC04DRAFT_2912449 [Pisolithus marmoratus]|nr:hypothetical protein EDC04DRAFT_2912449 [Pisolithus marmoratus]
MLGEYPDECEGIHPLTIEQYYGVHGCEQICQEGQIGAGHPPDENPDTDEEVVMDGHSSILRGLEADLQQQVCHEAVEVPGSGSPFACVEDEAKFWSLLDHVILEDITPMGYGLLLDEDGDESTQEHISIGPTWLRQAKTWCQALAVFTLFDSDGYFDV